MAIPRVGDGRQMGDGNLSEPVLINQAAPSTSTNSVTLTVEQLSTGLILATPTGPATYTLPTGILMDAGISVAKVGAAIDFLIVNQSTDWLSNITVAAGSGFSIGGGSTLVSPGDSAQFRARRIGKEVWVVYRTGSRGNALLNYGAFGSSIRSAISSYVQDLRTRPIVIFGIGDSNFTGEGAGDGQGAVPKLNNAFGYGPIEQIATFLPTLSGLPVKTTSWMGEGNSANNSIVTSAYNPKITLGTDWVRTVGVDSSLVGKFFQGNANSAGYFSYSFGAPITHVEIYAIVNATNSEAVGIYNSANTLITTINTNGTDACTRFTVTGNFADGIVKVKNNGAANCYLAGMIAWNSAEKSIILVRGSYSGSLVNSYTSTASIWSGMGFYPAIAPDLAIVSLTINDIVNSTTRANYNTGLTYIADFVCRYGDCVISTGGNGTNAAYSNGTSVGIEAEAKLVAGKFGAQFVSMHKEWTSWAATNAIGQEYDGNHRTRTGYVSQAKVYANVLRSMVNW